MVLVGLVLNATLGWAWADPNAAVALKEGRDAWQGKGCCAPAAVAVPAANAEAGDAGGCGPACACYN